jgi:hypothetical protein
LAVHFLRSFQPQTTPLGLRIAPPEAAGTGNLFGDGVYFADAFVKSWGYTGGTSTRFLLLSEVALGKIEEYMTFPSAEIIV